MFYIISHFPRRRQFFFERSLRKNDVLQSFNFLFSFQQFIFITVVSIYLMRFSIVFFFVYLRAFYRIVNAFVAKYLVAAAGRDVSSVAINLFGCGLPRCARCG